MNLTADAVRERQRKMHSNGKINDNIMDAAARKIDYVSSKSKKKKFIIFRIPNAIANCKINVKEALFFVRREMEALGYKVIFLRGFRMIIHWYTPDEADQFRHALPDEYKNGIKAIPAGILKRSKP